MSFWGELKRRNVYKVGVAYAIVAWLLIQFAAIAFPHLNFPSWAVLFVIVIFIIGFPLALLLAWAYEVTPEGIKRTKQVPLDESITHLTGQKLNYIVTGLLVVAVAALVFDNYLLDKDAVEPEAVSTETEQTPVVSEAGKAKKTIAVLPFVNLSSDPEQEYFVDGLSEEIINSLTQIPDLGVTGRTSSFTFKGSSKKAQEIANELGVENILEGSVRKSGNSLRITAQLVHAADDLHLWSKTYDRELKDIFAVQEDIAKAVASELKITLGVGKSFKQLGGTQNVEAYELFMVARGLYREGPGKTRLALESIDAAIALDPEYALAWSLMSDIHMGLCYNITDEECALEMDKSLAAAQKSIDLEPNLAEGYASIALNKTTRGDWIEAELALSKACELVADPSLYYQVVNPWCWLSVGRIEMVKENLEAELLHDPLNINSRAFYLGCLGLFGDTKIIEEENKRGRGLHGDKWAIDYEGGYNISYSRLGIGIDLSREDLPYSSLIFNTAKDYLESPKTGLSELRRIFNNKDKLSSLDCRDISMWAAYFDDPEFALEGAETSFKIGQANTVYVVWFPVMHKVRQLPRFKEFVRKIGLVDYWNKFGWPDICHQLDNGDFECD